jgi:hypothetical protein
LTDDDQLVSVNGVLKGKLLENEMLVQQATSNNKEQFANLPDLKDALLHAIMDAPTTMRTQALGSNACARACTTSCSGRHSCMKRCGREQRLHMAGR